MVLDQAVEMVQVLPMFSAFRLIALQFYNFS